LSALVEINPAIPEKDSPGAVPLLLGPLSIAARDGRDLEEPMNVVIHALGFDSVYYGFTTARTLQVDPRTYAWSTLPKEWVQEYEYNSYFELDPFLADRWTNPTPIIWDQRIAKVRRNIAAYLRQAAHYGIYSGAAVYFRDEHYSRTMFGVHSSKQHLSDADLSDWISKLPALLILAIEFHAIFRRRLVAAGARPLQPVSPLSPRELQCLSFASRGLTSADMALKLGLSERTINFHFGNILTKLAVANRAEAVGKAIAQGVINGN